MITIGQTFDKELIRKAVTSPANWDAATDDAAPRMEDYEPVLRDDLVYLAGFDGDEFLGCFIFCRMNAVLWEVHTRLLPAAYGPKARELALMARKWMWEHGAWRIQTTISSSNQKAIQFAMKSGMDFFGLNHASWGKNGKLEDLLMFGISRPVEV